MRFANRTEWTTDETAWSRALEARRRSGLSILDLTASNPTQCGFRYEANLLAELSAEGARTYDPDPRGMLAAREAVCGYYGDHGALVDPEQVVLTTSTSEGYSWLFRLLCDPGDEVLIAQPSYPLFELLATIDDVRLVPYALFFDPGGDPVGILAAVTDGVSTSTDCADASRRARGRSSWCIRTILPGTSPRRRNVPRCPSFAVSAGWH